MFGKKNVNYNILILNVENLEKVQLMNKHFITPDIFPNNFFPVFNSCGFFKSLNNDKVLSNINLNLSQ